MESPSLSASSSYTQSESFRSLKDMARRIVSSAYSRSHGSLPFRHTTCTLTVTAYIKGSTAALNTLGVQMHLCWSPHEMWNQHKSCQLIHTQLPAAPCILSVSCMMVSSTYKDQGILLIECQSTGGNIKLLVFAKSLELLH